MTRELDHMINAFPAHRGKLIDLYDTNEDFRSLCDDYWQCNCSLNKIHQDATHDKRSENSYKMLCLDLEQEVLQYLNK